MVKQLESRCGGGRTMSGLQTGPLVPTVRTQNNLSGPTGPTGGDNVAGIPTTGDRCTYVDYNYDVATAVICSMCLVFGVVYSLFVSLLVFPRSAARALYSRRQENMEPPRRTQLMKRPAMRRVDVNSYPTSTKFTEAPWHIDIP
uniref:Uncharacterized protein n=1 Tax=Timema bartmani TaxID=61472 RepID=A0A7R9ES45_9NEOP|nr:unnamed protein product [Timema bartmani]